MFKTLTPICCTFLLLGALAGCSDSETPSPTADAAAQTTSSEDSATANNNAGSTASKSEVAAALQDAQRPATDQPQPAGETADDAPADSPVTFALCAEGLPTSGMWKCDPVFADINKDGNLDLAAIPRLGNGPAVWFGDGNGTWSSASNGLERTDGKSCGGGVRLHDVNNDGELDLVVADHCNGVYVYLGDGAGNWDPVIEAMYPDELVPQGGVVEKYRGAESIAVGDINKDGNADLVVGASDEAGIRLYFGDGTGAGWARRDRDLPELGWAMRLELADMNDDGWLDIVASYSAGPRVYLNDQGEGWTDASIGLPTPMMGGIFWGLAVADINEDGRKDFAVANWIDGPEVYLQGEDGLWTKSPDVFEQMLGGSQGLALGDLDNDGHLDIVVSGRLNRDGGYIRGVFALKGDGSGTNWTYLENSGLPATGLAAMAGVGIADINNDGALDVAACSGLIVETVPSGPRAPSLPVNLLMWCNSQDTATAAASPED